MSNLLNMIQKEIDKGNVFITVDGTLVSQEKKEQLIKKDCIKFLKENSMDELADFKKSCEAKFVPTSVALSVIEATITDTINIEDGTEDVNS